MTAPVKTPLRLDAENCGGGVNLHAVVDGAGAVVAWTTRCVVGGREVVSEVIDADKAWPVLVAKYGVKVAEACVSMDTSKAGVERGMRVLRESMRGAEQRPPGVPPGKATIKSLHEDALATLRAAGCVTTKTSKTFDTYTLELPSND